ncbi:MAG: putative AAA+ superfamily ATPase [Verrucomicrobiales bacterium]|jgi:predicted AAA+ superfamily ATPase
MDVITRSVLHSTVQHSLENFRVTALIGPRQCGKTTLARTFPVSRENYFDLEDPLDEARLRNPRDVLGDLKGLIVIDEFQRMPELFRILRVLADRPERPARFLILGSAAPELMKGASETLAGRVHFIHMGGFTCSEVGVRTRNRLWLRGGFPDSYLAESDETSALCRRSFIQTFLHQDVPAFGINVAPEALRRFWTMAAHYHGQTWNSTAIASSMDISHTTARSYLDILTSTFVMRQLQPWLPNIKKRLVKSPKVYLRDSGLLHSLLQIETLSSLQSNPRYGASWEGFAIEQICATLQLHPGETYFWGTHGGAEMDLVVQLGGKLYGFEFKATEKPGVTHSMTIAQSDLKLSGIYLVYPGALFFPLRKGMWALGYDQLPELGRHIGF